MQPAEIFEKLRGKFADTVIELDETVASPYIRVQPNGFEELMRFLRDDPEMQFDSLQLVTGVDYPFAFASVYHLYSYSQRHKIAVRADLPRDKPEIDSVADIWPAADWHERETFDLMGIVYRGHPDLRRILCPEDWEGHPLRKDYVQPEEYHGISNVRKVGNDWYPRPDEDLKTIQQYKP